MLSRWDSSDVFSATRSVVIDQQALLALAERVAAIARERGVETALIGAAAMAVHGRVRGTCDVDLASSVNPYDKLRDLETALRAEQLRTRLRFPDEDDVLGGVLRCWLPQFEDEDGAPLGYVEIVNFFNPHQPRKTPARDAIARSVAIDSTSPLRAVTLADVIAFKLYASSRQDHADIVELLVQNPDADLEHIRQIASPFDRDGVLEQLVAEAAVRR